MPETVQRIALAVLGAALLAGSGLLLARPGRLFGIVERFRDRHPATRTWDPLARFNTPSLSRAAAIGMGLAALFMGLLVIAVSILGRAEMD